MSFCVTSTPVRRCSDIEIYERIAHAKKRLILNIQIGNIILNEIKLFNFFSCYITTDRLYSSPT